MPNDAIIRAFHAAARTSRDSIFADTELMPRSAPQDAVQAACGWVGRDYRPGGTLMMGINPGGGGDAYRGNPTDARIYGCLRALAAAEGIDDQRSALAALSAEWIADQRTHNIWRLVEAVEIAVGARSDSLAFLNLVPFRTRGDRMPRQEDLHRAWQVATGPQVRALQPRRILALGAKVHGALLKIGADRDFEIILLKRMIGDAAVTPEARAPLAGLAPD